MERARREVAFYRRLADTIPVSRPKVLASYDVSSIGCALLMRAYSPAKGAEQWSQADYLEIAALLARLHAAFWNRTLSLSDYDWLRSLPIPDTDLCIRLALPAWQALREAHPIAFSGYSAAGLEKTIEKSAALQQSLSSFPQTLCHNDFHSGNLLEEEGQFLVADWQEVGIGYGPEDLSFLYQRADTVPDPVVIRAYHHHLEAETGTSLDFDAINRVIAISELWTRVIHWPQYLIHVSEERVAYHLHRIKNLRQSL